MKTITIELLVDDSEVARVRERILYLLTDELGYEEDIDFIFANGLFEEDK